MKGMLYTADHHVYELPPLLEWNVRHTGTVPCDSWSVTAVYRPEMAPVLKMTGLNRAELGELKLEPWKILLLALLAILAVAGFMLYREYTKPGSFPFLNFIH